MAITRKADAHWQGGLQTGGGQMRLGSGLFEGAYSFNSRLGDGTRGTNPEELLAASHAGCYTMALSAAFERAGHPVTDISTTASVQIDTDPPGLRISKIHLKTVGKVPGVDAETFEKMAQDAKINCLISKILGNVEVTLDATLLAE